MACVAHQVLSCLHILGRGNFFEDMSQASHMSEAVIQSTFHKFNRLFANEFYHEHVRLPTGADQDKVIAADCFEPHPPITFLFGLSS